MLSLQARSYCGDYGEAKTGTDGLLHVRLCNGGTDADLNKISRKLIFVIDTSGSMQTYMPWVRACLSASNKIFQGEMAVVQFNSRASVFWPDASSPEFETKVQNLRASGDTNLADGLKLAYSLVAANQLTSIIVLTDGSPNTGPILSVADFAAFSATKSSWWTQVTAMGFGTNYNEEILQSIGRFAHVPTEKDIPAVFGRLIGELTSTRYVRCRLLVDAIPLPLVIGEPLLDVMPSGATYDWGFAIPVNTVIKDNQQVIAVYADLLSKTMCQVTATVIVTKQAVPDDVKYAYYADAAGKMAKELAIAKFAQHVVAKVEAVLGDWKGCKLALPLVEQMRRLLDSCDTKESSAYVQACSRQSSSTSASATPYAPTPACATTSSTLCAATSSNTYS